MIDVLELPFDQYQRYKLVADLLDEVRPPGARWSVLDVGGRTALLRAFLPRDRVTLVDLEASPEPGLVLGDGARLPFATASFDAVTAFDTLEHVPPPRREAFVAECRRVARRYVAIAGPCQHPAVEEAERLLQRFLKDKLGVEHRFLEEHRHHGLPDRGSVEAQLSASGARVTSVGHGSVERWLALMCVSMYMDYTYELHGVAARFFRFYNENLYRSDHRAPVYRHAILAALDGAPLPSGRGALAPPETPPGAVARITELAFELVGFERASLRLREEREVLRGMVATLKEDLEAHRRNLELALVEGNNARLQLEAACVQIDRVREILRENDAKITELRRELSGRWKNIKRAIGPRRPPP